MKHVLFGRSNMPKTTPKPEQIYTKDDNPISVLGQFVKNGVGKAKNGRYVFFSYSVNPDGTAGGMILKYLTYSLICDCMGIELFYFDGYENEHENERLKRLMNCVLNDTLTSYTFIFIGTNHKLYKLHKSVIRELATIKQQTNYGTLFTNLESNTNMLIRNGQPFLLNTSGQDDLHLQIVQAYLLEEENRRKVILKEIDEENQAN